jgi:hypothetical protein
LAKRLVSFIDKKIGTFGLFLTLFYDTMIYGKALACFSTMERMMLNQECGKEFKLENFTLPSKVKIKCHPYAVGILAEKIFS